VQKKSAGYYAAGEKIWPRYGKIRGGFCRGEKKVGAYGLGGRLKFLRDDLASGAETLLLCDREIRERGRHRVKKGRDSYGED